MTLAGRADTSMQVPVNAPAPQLPPNRQRQPRRGAAAPGVRRLLAALLGCALALTARAADRDMVRISVHKDRVETALMLYERLTKKPVFIALDLQALVSIEPPDDLSREAAITLIRTTLLERYGIELRTTKTGETLAAWSKDPKYPRHTEEPEPRPEPPLPGKGRIRTISPPEQ